MTPTLPVVYARAAQTAESRGDPNQTLSLDMLHGDLTSSTIEATNKPVLVALAMSTERMVPVPNQIVPYEGDSRQTKQFNFEGDAVRTVLDENGDPLFVASDVCKVLGIANERNVYARLDDDEKGVREIDTPGGPQQMTVVSESGLYSIILRSDKPQAKVFKRWITHEVLPSIRKTGGYQVARGPVSQLDIVEGMVVALRAQERQLAELQQQQAQQAIQIEDIHDELLDRDYYTVLQWCQKQHIQHTPSLRQKWGKEATALSTAQNIEIKNTNEGMYNVGRYHKSILASVCVPKPKSNGQLSLLSGGK